MPVDRGAIDTQLREIGEGERWWEQREFRALPHILHADERILGLVNGKLLGPRRPRLRAPRWLIVATDLRLICLKQERFARRQVDIPAGQIVAIDQRTRLRAFQITVDTPQRRFRIRIPKADAFRFTGALAPLIPTQPAFPHAPGMEAWSRIPGMSAVAALPGFNGLVSLLAPPPQTDTGLRAQVERMESTVEQLQQEVERLQQQVAFLEDLLHTRAGEAALARTSEEA